MHGFISELFFFCFIDLCVFFFSCQYHIVLITMVLVYSQKSGSVIVIVKKCIVRNCYASSFVLSQDYFDHSGLFSFHTDFKIICSTSVKNASGNLARITLNLQFALNSMDINNINSSNPLAQNIFPFICVFFNLHQCLRVFSVYVSHFLG